MKYLMGGYGSAGFRHRVDTWRLPCSSCLAMTCLLIKDHNVLTQEELHRSLQVEAMVRWVVLQARKLRGRP